MAVMIASGSAHMRTRSRCAAVQHADWDRSSASQPVATMDPVAVWSL
jgi:hypothetical protein